MICKLTFDDGRIDWCTAKNELHLLKEYDKEYDLPLQEIESLEKISEVRSKTIMVKNTDYNEDRPDGMPEKFPLWDLVSGDDFEIIASTEFE